MDSVDQMFELVLRGRVLESVGMSMFALGGFVVFVAIVICCIIDTQHGSDDNEVKEAMTRIRRVTVRAIVASALLWLLSAAGCCASSMYPKSGDLETIGTYKAVKEACSSDMFKAFVESVMDSNIANQERKAENGGK